MGPRISRVRPWLEQRLQHTEASGRTARAWTVSLAQAFAALVKARCNLHRLLHRMFNRESVVPRSLGRPNHENHAEGYGNYRAKTSALKIKGQISLGSFLRTESGILVPNRSRLRAVLFELAVESRFSNA